jgi:AcrR family transcriptional regulator
MKNVNKQLSHRQRQALATQQVILEAARALFLERGYGTTTIESISEKAGVAVSTVYSIYKNKRGILAAIRETWHQESGQREIYQMALSESDPQRRMELFARATRCQWETSATMISIYNGAAAVDPDAAGELKEALAGRRANLSHFISETAAMLRPGLTHERAAAIYLALTHAEVYLELVDVFGWSSDEYETWLAEILKQQLLP